MSIIDINIAKQHLRVDHDDDGQLIQMYLDGAEDAAMQYMNRKVYADSTALQAAVADGTAGDDPIVIQPSMKNGMLLILGDLYSMRENTTERSAVELPMGAKALLQPFRVGVGV